MSETQNEQPYTVVVGVSVTSGSPAAVAWAAAQAEANHGRLVAVRVHKRPDPVTDPRLDPASGRPPDDRSKDLTNLAAEVAATLGPEHSAQCRVLYGGKRRSLLAVAAGADLLVIDAARSPSSSSLLAQRVISASPCPVVVLPPALNSEPDSRLSRAGRSVGESALRAAATSGRPGYRPPG